MFEMDRWVQPFRWGLLMAFDDSIDWELRNDFSDYPIAASDTCLTVKVLHAQDIETPEKYPEDVDLPEAQVQVIVMGEQASPDTVIHFSTILTCASGALTIGDAENERKVQVGPGKIPVQVSCFPEEDPEVIIFWIDRSKSKPHKISSKEIEAGMSAKGGFTREQLAKWGVPWPPPKGWRKALVAGKPILKR